MNDFASPLLTMQQMLKDYERLLIARRWQEAVAMAPDLSAQLRFLIQTVRIQAEETKL